MALTHDQAVELVARYGRVQRVIRDAATYDLPHAKLVKLKKKYGRCPRCGKASAAIFRSPAMSNSADVYICEWCDFDESLEELFQRSKPLERWAICEAPERWGLRVEGGAGREG